jgi:hypothetical protein
MPALSPAGVIFGGERKIKSAAGVVAGGRPRPVRGDPALFINLRREEEQLQKQKQQQER